MSEFPKIFLKENIENNVLVVDILHKIYHHYPIGLCDFKNAYPGYLEMKKMVENKIDFECNDQGSISNRFVSQLQDYLPSTRIENQNYFNFPNYAVSFHIYNKDYGHIVHDTFIKLYISLICDYYTIFLADEYRYRQISPKNGKWAVKDLHSIFSFSENYNDSYDNVFMLIKKTMDQFFPDKKFVSHVFLHDFRISESVPFGQEYSPNPQDNYYNFFELLFHFNQKSESVKILS